MGFISDIVEGITDFVEDVFNAVVDVFSAVFSAIGSAISGLFGGFSPDVPTPGASQSPDGVVITKAGTNVDIPIVYGFRRVGGRIVFAETNGTDNKYLYVVYAICEGEIEGIKRIYIDDTQLPNPSGGKYATATTHTIGSGRYSGRLQLQVFNGTETQGQSSLANQTASWSSKTRKMPGVAYAVMRYEWKKIESQEDADNNPYRGGIPSVKFDVLGKKVYNVITHAGGEDLANDYADLTKAHSYNPVNCALDYLMNTRWGAGLDKTEINADAFKTAAIKCNQQVTYSTGVTGKAITMNAVLSVTPKILDNVKILLSGCRAFLPYIQGRYKIKIEDGGNATDITSASLTSAFDVTTDHIIGSVNMQGEQKSNKYNQVIVRYVDPDLNFTEQQQVYTESVDVTSDGEDLIGDFQFFTIANKNIAQDIARMIYKKSRNQRYIQVTATPELLEVEPGDIIRITSDVWNLSTQTFRVTNMSFTAGGNISVQAREHDATLYPFVSGDQIEIPAQTYRPDTFILQPVSGINPATPISVAPPNDQEDTVTDPTLDSAGAPTSTTSSSTDNDALPETKDLGNISSVTTFDSQSIAQFNSSNTVLTSTHCLLYNLDVENSAVNLTGSFTAPIAQIITGQGDGITATISFFVKTPQTSYIDKIRFYIFDKNTKVLKETQLANITRFDTQVAVPVYLQRLTKDTYIRPKFYSTALDQEFADGSTGTYSAFSFTNLEGTATTGKTLEAVLNNIIQTSDQFGNAQSTVQSTTATKETLG